MTDVIPIARPSIGDREYEAIKPVFDSRWIGRGKEVIELEQRLRDLFGVRHAVTTNSGTSALHLALSSLGVGRGDEVILPSMTFVAPAHAILYCGATPVFVDVDPNTVNINVDDLKRKINGRTAAIIPTHYNGIPADMDEIMEIARERRISVVEDAAHGFGATYKGRKLGTIGHAGCFSFDPIKNVSCIEGGVVLTDRDETAELMQSKVNLGLTDAFSRFSGQANLEYDVATLGYRYHMGNVNASIGMVQLDSFDERMDKKRKIVGKYDERFDGLEKIKLLDVNHDTTPPLVYVVKVKEDREGLAKSLLERGIQTRVWYPPIHKFSLFGGYFSLSGGDSSDLPVTEQLGKELLTLPLYSDMTGEEVDRVISGVEEWNGAA